MWLSKRFISKETTGSSCQTAVKNGFFAAILGPDFLTGAPLFWDMAESHIFAKARWLNRRCYSLFCCFVGGNENEFTSP